MDPDLVPFAAARALFPVPVSLQTLHRWRTVGIRGKKLATVLIGGRRFVSRQAAIRFATPDDSQATAPRGHNHDGPNGRESDDRPGAATSCVAGAAP